jgi:hypothetical protein
LIDWILKHTEPDETYYLFKGGCGRKLRNIDHWPLAEAALIHARALALFRRISRQHNAVVDTSWSNVYRTGDYCIPHSHVRAQASIVYMLEPGNAAGDDPNSGRFMIVDPRLNACCKDQEGCMTTPFIPDMPPGTMLIFPGQIVHGVNPYDGNLPRITLAWNLNGHKIHQLQPWELLKQQQDQQQ